jgi:hypothetical protein
VHELYAVFLASGSNPQFISSICTRNRRNILTHETAASVLIEEWQRARERHRWAIGRYVIMLTTCISFAGQNMKQRHCHGSSALGRHGPAERSKKPDRSRRQRLQLRNLFGNVNSSTICCVLARDTAKNGITFVRRGFVASADDWSYAGEIEQLEF